MSIITRRPYCGEADLDAIAPFLKTCAAVDPPDEVASAIAFLCSDDAAYITGEAVNVSGGQTMV